MSSERINKMLGGLALASETRSEKAQHRTNRRLSTHMTFNSGIRVEVNVVYTELANETADFAAEMAKPVASNNLSPCRYERKGCRESRE